MASRYWVGGSSVWNATAGTKWALTSGGAGGQAVPTSVDDVFFNSASGAVTITVGDGVALNCHDISFAGTSDADRFPGTITFTGVASSTSLNVYGSMTLSWLGTIIFKDYLFSTNFKGTANHTITSCNRFLGYIVFQGTGTYTLQDSLVNPGSEITHSSGTLATGNNNVLVGYYGSMGTTTRTLSLGTMTFECNGSSINGGFQMSGSNCTITNAENSTIKIGRAVLAVTFNFNCPNVSMGNLWLDVGTRTGNINFFNSMTGATFKDWLDTGTASHTYNFNMNNALTVHVGSFRVSGDASHTITLTSNDQTKGPVNLIKDGGGIVFGDYLNIQHMAVTPANTWYAGTHSVNNQGTSAAGSGYNFTNPPGDFFQFMP